MSEGMSSRRREWYDETREPDEPPKFSGMMLDSGALRVFDKSGDLVLEIGKMKASIGAIGTHFHASIQADAISAGLASVKPITHDQSTETPQEQALRKKKEGHSWSAANSAELRKSARSKSRGSRLR